jgi:hypothetical protein
MMNLASSRLDAGIHHRAGRVFELGTEMLASRLDLATISVGGRITKLDPFRDSTRLVLLSTPSRMKLFCSALPVGDRVAITIHLGPGQSVRLRQDNFRHAAMDSHASKA